MNGNLVREGPPQLMPSVTYVEVRSAQISQLYGQVRTAMLAVIGAAFALAALMWSAVPHERILVWLVVLLAAQLPRHVLVQRFHDSQPKGAEALPWGTWFFLGSGATALLFGLSAAVIFPTDSLVHQCILTCFLGGFAAATAVAHAPLTECYVSSILLSMVPLLGRFVFQGGEFGILLSTAGVAFVAALLATAKAMNGLVAHSIRLGFEKDNLLEQVSESRATLHQAVLERTAELSQRNRELADEIQQRQEVETKLRQSEDRYRNLFTYSHDAINIVTEEGRFVDFNEAFLKLIGYDADELLSLESPVLWEHPQERLAWVHRLKQQGYLVEFPMKARRKDGEIRNCMLTSTARQLPDGSVHYQSICRDVTEQERAQRAVRESEEKLRDIVELLPEPVFETDLAGNITFSSAKGYELFGYEREDLKVGLHVSQLVAAHDVERAIRNTQRVLDGEPLGGIDYTAVRKDGTTFPVFVHALPRRQGETAIGIRGVVVDMTARKEAEEELRRIENLYRSVIDNIEDVFYRSDGQGKLRMASASGARLFGYDSVEDMIGRPLEGFWNDPEELRRFLSRLETHGSVEEYEAVLKRKDDSTFVASFTTHFFRNEDGSIQGMQGIIRDITARKEVEKKLLLSEARLRQIIDLVPHFIFAKDLDGRFVLGNQAVADAYGTTVDGIVGKKDEDFCTAKAQVLHFRSDDLTVMSSGMRKVIAEEAFTDANGQLRWLSTVKIPFNFSGSDAPSVLGVSVDITERKQALEALRASETRLRLAWETCPHYFSITRLNDGLIVDINNGFTEVTGYSRNEAIGKTSLELNIWADAVDRATMFDMLTRDGQIRDYESKFCRKDGQLRTVTISAGLMPLDGVPHVLAIVEDVEELKQARGALARSEELFRTYFELGLVGMALTSPDKRWMHVNDRACEILGYTREELLQTTWQVLIHPHDLESVLLQYRRMLAGEIKGFSLDKRFFRKDGSLVHATLLMSCIRGPEGTVEHVITLVHDITDRLEAQQELAEALRRSRLQLEAISEIAISPALVSGDTSVLVRGLTELGARTLGVERVSVWLFSDDHETLTCIDLYESSRDTHSSGDVLTREQYKAEFAALATTRYVDAHDSLTDPRTTGYVETYLKPHCITSMLDAVIRKGGEHLGVICFEHVDTVHRWHADEIAFACQISDQFAIALHNRDRKAADDQIRENEAKYRTLIESSPDGVFVQVGDVVEYANSAMAEMVGAQSPEHLRGVRVLDLVHPDYRQQICERIARNFDEDKAVPLFEQQLFRLDGSVFSAEAVAAPISYKGHKARQVLVRDITERKRTEQAIRSIVEGVSREIGEQYFESSVIHFARILGADLTHIGEIRDCEGRAKIRTVAVSSGGELQQNFEYGLEGSPCEIATKQGMCSYPSGVAALFPHDEGLRKRAIEAYVGVCLYDSHGVPIGIMAAMYVHPLDNVEFAESVLRIFASRAAAEMERSKAEEALRSSEERLRLAWETSPDALSISRLEDGTYVDVNEGYTFITGYAKEEVIGKSALEIPFWADPRDREPLAEHLRKHGIIRNFETRLRRKDGLTRTVLVSAGLMMLSGEPSLFAVTKDVEDLKRVEMALRESEQKYRLLAENVSDVIWIADANLNFSYISPSAERLYGWDASEWMHLSPSEYLTPHSLGLVHKILAEERALQGPPGLDLSRVRTVELEQFRKDGTTFWTEVSVRFLYDENGLLASLIGATRDITERRRSQEQLHILFAAIQQAGETILITEKNGTIIYANPAFEKTTGYSIADVVGKPASILKNDQYDESVYRDMRSTVARGQVWRGRFTNRKKDGSLYEETATISPIKDESGQVVNYVMVGRDVTVETMLQKQLNQAQKMEAIGTLAGGIAHDFNNLLQAILGYSDLILMKKEKGDPDRKKLEIIQHAARDGADLVSRILAVSRKADSKARPMDLNEAIRRAMKLLRRTIPRMIDIRLELDRNLRIIDADPAQLEQILLNLAINAGQAMPERGQLLIETSNVSLDDEYLRTHIGARPGPHVLLTVSDNGVGIRREFIDRIFEPFFTTKINGQGTGLGLAMVHGIVSQHGGYIRCYSEPGRGTSFKIYFPVSSTESISDSLGTLEMPAFGSETILLVDDDERVRIMAQQLIKMGGYGVLTAASGEEALQVYADRGTDISLVILDLIMPGMGGRRCLEELLRMDPMVRVLVASGYSSNGVSQEEKGKGARGFISKPYDARSILTAIRKVLDRGHL